MIVLYLNKVSVINAFTTLPFFKVLFVYPSHFHIITIMVTFQETIYYDPTPECNVLECL